MSRHYRNTFHRKNPRYNNFNDYFKYLPLLCICLLIFLHYNPITIENPQIHNPLAINDNPNIQTSEGIHFTVPNGINPDFVKNLIFVVIYLTLIYSSYKSFLIKKWIIRRNIKLVKITLIGISLLIISSLIDANSDVGKSLDFITSMLLIYSIISTSYIMVKVIDNINLRSDLKCWGIRIVGALFVFTGLGILFANSLATTFYTINNNGSILYASYTFFVLSICMMLIGVFCVYRSKRRYGIFIYHE